MTLWELFLIHRFQWIPTWISQVFTMYSPESELRGSSYVYPLFHQGTLVSSFNNFEAMDTLGFTEWKRLVPTNWEKGTDKAFPFGQKCLYIGPLANLSWIWRLLAGNQTMYKLHMGARKKTLKQHLGKKKGLPNPNICFYTNLHAPINLLNCRCAAGPP